MLAIRKAFDLMDDDIIELSAENETLKKGSYDEKGLEESKAKLLRQVDDEKQANVFVSRMQKQMKSNKV